MNLAEPREMGSKKDLRADDAHAWDRMMLADKRNVLGSAMDNGLLRLRVPDQPEQVLYRIVPCFHLARISHSYSFSPVRKYSILPGHSYRV